jgi:16S rRNA processing protein RimM
MPHKEPEKSNEPGLLKKSEPVFLAFAKIRKPHGLNGEVTVEMLSDFPEHVSEGDVLYIGKDYKKITLHSIRKAGKTYLISFKDHHSRDSVDHLRNEIIFILSDMLPELNSDEFYHHDLIGMMVYDLSKNLIGVISEIITTGANDVYVVTAQGAEKQEILLPAIRSVVREVDLESRCVFVEMPEWL